MESEEMVPHSEVIGPMVESTLHDLQTLGVLERCYLAGGTGLALRLGHRRSHDLDFFSGGPVDPEALTRSLKSLAGFALASQAPGTLHATLHNVKISFLAYPYPLLFPFATFAGANVADPREIACMKLSAIASRGTKRAFVDLYFVARQHGLAQLLEWFKRKYVEVNQNLVHVLKSLTSFDDAEKDPMPDMLVPSSREDVRRYFAQEVPRSVP